MCSSDLLNQYRIADIPDGAEALKLTWREKVTGLVCGEKPWFDARVICEFLGPDNKKMQGVSHPGPAYTQRDTNGWRDREMTFLVPSGAAAVAFMPCLFQAKAGVYELADIRLEPADPAGPRATSRRRSRTGRSSRVRCTSRVRSSSTTAAARCGSRA